MTSRERLTSIFQGRVPDRPAVKLWGLQPNQKLLHPDYEPVYRLAMETSDIVVSAGSPFDLVWGMSGAGISKHVERPTESKEWVEVVTEVQTPLGPLGSVFRRSTVGNPGYQEEHLLKEPGDIRKVLSVPYKPFPFSTEAFKSAEAAIGDRGLVMFGLDHPMYGLERMIGSENFALWSLECRDLLRDTIRLFAERVRHHVVRAFDAGLKPVFAWVGPELCIPPLMSPADFDDLVMQFDKPLCSLIHERGGQVWVHCHGKMGPVLERFVDMGVDVLNPLEPPPMGDITLPQAFARVGDRMGLEGNVETHDLMTASKEEITRQVRAAMAVGRGRRFILCPSSGYMEWPRPTPRFIENLLACLQEGVRSAEAART